MRPGTSHHAALQRDTIERAAQYLTRTQADGLRRIRDHGPYAWCDGYGRAGGAISRMFDRMVAGGLCTRAPHEITGHGRVVLARYEEAHGKGLSVGPSKENNP